MTIRVKILAENGNFLRFVVQGLDISVANSLRRVMISDVPSMAIDDVIIIENSSPMRDELLAHRLGLIPLKTDLESYNLRDNCDCESELGCSKCNVTLTLEAEAVDLPRTVYSKELKSSDPYIIPVNGEIPILKLSSNQKVRLEAYARLGRGSEHAKWQPTSVCTLRPSSKIIIDLKRCDICGKCVEECNKQILRINDGRITIQDYEECNGCRRCENSCPKDAIRVEISKDALVFYIESTGALPPESIFNNAVMIMKEKAQEFISHISNLKLDEYNEKKSES